MGSSNALWVAGCGEGSTWVLLAPTGERLRISSVLACLLSMSPLHKSFLSIDSAFPKCDVSKGSPKAFGRWERTQGAREGEWGLFFPPILTCPQDGLLRARGDGPCGWAWLSPQALQI